MYVTPEEACMSFEKLPPVKSLRSQIYIQIYKHTFGRNTQNPVSANE